MLKKLRTNVASLKISLVCLFVFLIIDLTELKQRADLPSCVKTPKLNCTNAAAQSSKQLN